jgi:hypothetical protein
MNLALEPWDAFHFEAEEIRAAEDDPVFVWRFALHAR